MNKEMLEMAKKLVNIELNEIIKRWAQLPESLKCYAIRYESVDDRSFALQPTHGNIFFGIGRFIDIAQACHLSFYINIAKNEDGIDAPTLHIYY